VALLVVVEFVIFKVVSVFVEWIWRSVVGVSVLIPKREFVVSQWSSVGVDNGFVPFPTNNLFSGIFANPVPPLGTSIAIAIWKFCYTIKFLKRISAVEVIFSAPTITN